MRRVFLLAALSSSAPACDSPKLGIEGATCTASSDCAGELQCIKSTCVALRASVDAPGVVEAAPQPIAVVAPKAPAHDSTQVTAPAAPPESSPASPAVSPAGAGAPGGTESTPWPDVPTWNFSAAVKAGDPWATSIIKTLQDIRIGTYAGSAASAEYKFRLGVCLDGSLQATRKQSTGDSTLGARIDAAIGGLKVPVPEHVRHHLGRGCKRIPYEFTYATSTGKVR